jgi:hypothetical protein
MAHNSLPHTHREREREMSQLSGYERLMQKAKKNSSKALHQWVVSRPTKLLPGTCTQCNSGRECTKHHNDSFRGAKISHVNSELEVHVIVKELNLTPTGSDKRFLYYDGPSPPADWKTAVYNVEDPENNTPYDGATLLKLARFRVKNRKLESTKGCLIVCRGPHSSLPPPLHCCPSLLLPPLAASCELSPIPLVVAASFSLLLCFQQHHCFLQPLPAFVSLLLSTE